MTTAQVPHPHTGHNLDLGNTVGVTEDNTDLRGGGTLLRELADLVDDLVGGGLEPRRGGARVGERRGADALALGVKTAHVVGIGDLSRLSGKSFVVARRWGEGKVRLQTRVYFKIGLRPADVWPWRKVRLVH